jgi:hypothetical protein
METVYALVLVVALLGLGGAALFASYRLYRG